MPRIIKTTHAIEIDGLADLASQLPDNDWYELRIRVRRMGEGAEVDVPNELFQVQAPEDVK